MVIIIIIIIIIITDNDAVASSRLFPIARRSIVGRWDPLDVGQLHGLALLLGDGLADGVLQLRAGLGSLAPGSLGRAFAIWAQ